MAKSSDNATLQNDKIMLNIDNMTMVNDNTASAFVSVAFAFVATVMYMLKMARSLSKTVLKAGFYHHFMDHQPLPFSLFFLCMNNRFLSQAFLLLSEHIALMSYLSTVAIRRFAVEAT